MRPVWPTEHAPTSGPLWTNTRAPCHHDLTLNSDCSASDHCYEPESGHLCNSAHAWPEYWTRPVSILDVSGHVWNIAAWVKYRTRPLFMSDASGHPVTNAFNSYSLSTSSPLQMCQHHQVYNTLCTCVSFSQIFFKELTTQLDPKCICNELEHLVAL